MCESRGGDWGPDPPPPLEIHKAKGFLRNTGLIFWKITKLPSQHHAWIQKVLLEGVQL